VSVDATESRQTFMKVGPRNAMVIAVVSLAVRVDGENLRAAFGSAGPVPTLVRAGLGDADSFPQRVAEAASPIDDVRGTALYRRHALHILTRRALDRCLV
jgi:CO/xanthine dehydrogenase FAD-binding subunit